MSNSFKVFLVILLCAFAFFGWYYQTKTIKIEQKKSEKIVVGWIGPLTGPVSVLGIDNLNAIKMAFAEYEKTKSQEDPEIELIAIDDEYLVKTKEAYEKMVHQFGAKAIFVITYSGILNLANQALKDSVLLINPIDNDLKLSKINKNIFLIAKENEGLAAIVANALIDQAKKNTVVIYFGGDDFMPTLAVTVQEILSSNGSQVKLFKYSEGTKDFTEFLQWGKENNADSYVFFGYQEIGYAMKQARELDIKAPFYSVNVITDPILQQNSDGAIEGTYFSHFTTLDGNVVKSDEFIKNYKDKFKKQPILEWTAMQGYDAANILINAIKEASKYENHFTEYLRNELLDTQNFEGVSGTINILPSGASRGIYPSLYILREGKPIPLVHK